MALPATRIANDENIVPTKPSLIDQKNTRPRRVLGDVSPNVNIKQTPAFLAKPLAGSPLKRSFTAAMEGSGHGFTYLKRRKLSGEETLSQSQDVGRSVDGSIGSFRPVFRDEVQIPVIAEPSPTEPNTPTDDEPSTQGSAEERMSFSSLINYDPSSQTFNSIFRTISQAEMLKLKLRVAMYKVRTNQVDVPFVDLPVPVDTVLDSHAAAREAVEQLRREAREVAERDRSRKGARKLLPAPVLRPSTGWMGGMPSSPPGEAGLPTSAVTPMTDRRRPDLALEQELTSSVVKGRVAEGLLGLRHAV